MEPCRSKQAPLPELRPWAVLAHQQTVGDGGRVARRPVSRDVATQRRAWLSSERHRQRVVMFQKMRKIQKLSCDFHIIQTVEILPFHLERQALSAEGTELFKLIVTGKQVVAEHRQRDLWAGLAF